MPVFPTPEPITATIDLSVADVRIVAGDRAETTVEVTPADPGDSEDVKEFARGLVYWGQVPVIVTIGKTEFTTAMWPKDGRYLVPIKVAVQRAEKIRVGARVRVRLRVAGRSAD